MISNYLWIVLLILQCATVTPRPTRSQTERDDSLTRYSYDAQNKPKVKQNDEQVISVRITSSVAVGRGGARNAHKSHSNNHAQLPTTPPPILNRITETTQIAKEDISTDIPPSLVGANIEFIKQLNAKKEIKKTYNADPMHPFQLTMQNQFLGETDHLFERTNPVEVEKSDVNFKENFPAPYQLPFQQNNDSSDSLAEPSVKSFEINDKDEQYENMDRTIFHSVTQIPPKEIVNPTENYSQLRVSNSTVDTVAEPSTKTLHTISNNNDEYDEDIENIPLARSVPLSPSSQNYIQGLTSKSPSERGNGRGLTTVSFNIVHDIPKQVNNYNNEPSNTFTNSNQGYGRPHSNFYDSPKVYSQPAKIYGEPAKVYSEPAKVYSEPAKIYSEPAKIYSETAKIYSEPSKIYSEPAKFYSEPASLHLSPDNLPKYKPWQSTVQSTAFTNTPWIPSHNTGIVSTIVTTQPTTITVPDDVVNTQHMIEHMPEKNYEVDENLSIQTDGRSHGIQETSTEKCKQDNCKVGYVVEGRQYKKYRVEERTPDGFIVGEYGVVRNEDGALRGVRYTADSDASPRLIYDALMKFLQLK